MPFTDSFTDANNTNLEAHGGNWTNVDGAAGLLQINASNQLKCASTVGLYTAPDCGTPDHYAQAVVRHTLGSTGGFYVVRAIDQNNFIGARPNGSVYDAYKRISGTFTQIGTYVAANVSGDVYKIQISGTSVTVYLNGVSRITGTVSDGIFSGVTKAGLVPRSGAVNPWLDDFECTSPAGFSRNQSFWHVFMDKIRQWRNL